VSGYVYFIACEPMEAVKIGFTTKSPSSRLRALQTGSPSPLKMLGYVPGTQDEERKLHAAFSPLCIHLEWFRFEWKLRDFINYLTGSLPDHEITRESFLNALHDVLMQGVWNPYHYEISSDDYDLTGDWEPFRNELWDAFGPWEE
jgi:hypothetical protein